MATTVTYKGNTLVTIDNATKTLKTAGKYMEGDIIVKDSAAATDIFCGSFTATTDNSVYTINIPYTGSGYPLFVHIGLDVYPLSLTESQLPNYACVSYDLYKVDNSTSPTYNGGTDDLTFARIGYKLNSGLNNESANGSKRYITNNPSSVATTTVISVQSKTKIAIYIKYAASMSAHTFVPNIRYSYIVKYSS